MSGLVPNLDDVCLLANLINGSSKKDLPQYADTASIYMLAMSKRINDLEDAIHWALGETDFRPREDGEGAYWWRKELRERSRIAYTPPKDETKAS